MQRRRPNGYAKRGVYVRERAANISSGACARRKKRWLEIIGCLARGMTARETAALRGSTYAYIRRDLADLRKHFGAATNLEVVLIANREWGLKICDCRREAGQANSAPTG